MAGLEFLSKLPDIQVPYISAENGQIILHPRPEWVPAWFQELEIPDLASREASGNWDGMGCYKTSTALWVAAELEANNVLVITSKTGKIPYMIAAPKAVPEYEVINVSTGDPIHKPDPNAKQLYFAHYDVFTKRLPSDTPMKIKRLPAKARKKFQKPSPTAEALLKIPWDLVIVSEGHRLTRSATATAMIRQLKTRFKHLETGTQFINRPDEAWSPFKWLDKNVGGYWAFRGRYTTQEEWPPGSGFYRVTGTQNEEEFRELFLKYGPPRRTFSEVFKTAGLLPPHRVPVTLNPAQRKMYKELKKSKETTDLEGQPLFAPNVLSVLQRHRQICIATPQVDGEHFDEIKGKLRQKISLVEPSPKLDAMMDILMDTDTPTVVFSYYKDPIELAAKRLLKADISHIVYRAKDDDPTRLQKITEFQRGQTSVFLSTLKLASESITLTAADKVIFIDRHWSPLVNEQAIRRLYRPGQKRPVLPIYIEALDTVDQVVEETLQRKADWYTAIFG